MTVAAAAVGLPGAGRKSISRVPEQGTVIPVGMGWAVPMLVKVAM